MIDLFKGTNIPEEIQDDPEIIADLQAEKKEKPAEKPAEKSIEDKFDTSKEYLFKDGEKEEAAVVEKENEDGSVNIKIGDKLIENVKKDQLLTPPELTYEFENDVTIDDITFKKDVLKKTPVEVLENISRLTEKVKNLTGSTTAKEALLNDPIIKDRIQRIESGKGEEPYAVYGMSKQTAEKLKSELELTDEEMKVVYDQFKEDMEDNVRKVISTEKAKSIQETRSKEDARKGMNVLLGLAEINPAFKIKETDIEKIWTQGERHPEWKVFSEGIGKFQKHLIDKYGMKRYSEVTRFTPKALYAMVAADLDMPVAINTGERDRKIRMSEREKLLSIFNPKKIAGAMKSKSGDETTKQHASIDNDGAISKETLMGDTGYIDKVYDAAKTDDDIFEAQKLMLRTLNK
jgi:hypothetical protein